MPMPTSNMAIALAFGATIGVDSILPSKAETLDTAAAKDKADPQPEATNSPVDVSVDRDPAPRDRHVHKSND
jgi:hypothetical protein